MSMTKETRRHTAYFFIFGWIITCFHIVMSVESTYHMWVYIGISTVGLLMLLFATTADTGEKSQRERLLMNDVLNSCGCDNEDTFKKEIETIHNRLDALGVPKVDENVSVVLSTWGRIIWLVNNSSKSSAKETDN